MPIEHTLVLQSPVSDNGILRMLASVIGVSNVPSYTASSTCKHRLASSKSFHRKANSSPAARRSIAQARPWCAVSATTGNRRARSPVTQIRRAFTGAIDEFVAHTSGFASELVVSSREKDHSVRACRPRADIAIEIDVERRDRAPGDSRAR